MNKASPNIFKAVATGKHFDELVLTCRKATGDGGQEVYLTLTFNDAVFTYYDNSGTGGGNGLPVESVHFAFGKIKFEYKPQTAKGSMGAPVTAGYDLKENKAF